ncbi:MAG: hypothetical protein IJ594_02525 [Oscillospiraceae bacterium]|nr:hypothetical protein [Oscillospiraceae bacterium]
MAGGWKKAPVPLAVNGQLSLGREWLADFGEMYAVNTTSKTAKLYFGKDGTLTRDTTLAIGKKLYKFAADGTSALTAGWLDANKTQYVLKSGQLAKGRQKIDGLYYFFDNEGWRQSSTLRKSGGKWYYYGANGVQETPAMGDWYNGSFYVGGFNAGLTAVWNKDGSLKKIVYTASGRPAAGESVSFGWWTDPETALEEGLNGYVLDAKGLPKTGLVTDFTFEGETYGMLFNADGSRVVAYDCALGPAGKSYAVLEGALLYKRNDYVYVSDWSLLSAKDRKTMDMLRAISGEYSLVVLLHEDGSVCANEIVEGAYTNRLGVPMDEYSTIFKFGGKWYATFSGPVMLGDYQTGDMLQGMILTKADGELLGFYNAETGAKLSGAYAILSGPNYAIVNLKNGMPKPGKAKLGIVGITIEFDAELGIGSPYFT